MKTDRQIRTDSIISSDWLIPGCLSSYMEQIDSPSAGEKTALVTEHSSEVCVCGVVIGGSESAVSISIEGSLTLPATLVNINFFNNYIINLFAIHAAILTHICPCGIKNLLIYSNVFILLTLDPFRHCFGAFSSPPVKTNT